MSAYPEHEKLMAISDKSQAIGDFLTWTRATLCHTHDHSDNCYLDGHRKPQCGFYEGEFVPWRYDLVKTFADYFEIDLVKIDDEKRAMIDDLRKASR